MKRARPKPGRPKRANPKPTNKPAEAGEKDESMSSWIRVVLAALLVLWCLLINALFLFSPLTEQFGAFIKTLLSGTGMPKADTWFQVYLHAYASLLAPMSWNWGVGLDTWGPLLIGLAGFAVMTYAGRLLTRCFEIYVPLGAEIPLWFVMGVSACGMLNTALALCGLLYQWVSLLALAIMIGVLMLAARRARRRFILGAVPHPEESVVDPWMVHHAVRSELRQLERDSWLRPAGFLESNLKSLLQVMIVLLTALTFFHAVFFPEVYWDSLILYLGYARGIYLQHAFPLKVVGQVGVGLGANYPHLFEITGAGIATWANHWSPLYLQFATPLAGAMTLQLTYHTALRMTRRVLLALIATLFVCAAPYILTYHTWSSNYSFVILWGAAFFHLALRYLEERRPGYFCLGTLVAAFAMNLNYLMGSIWICWALWVLLAHGGGFIRLFTQGWFWRLGAACAPIASAWYIRNWIVTGNPVYAFFTNIFKGSKHVNPEVMKSATLEWQSHGDGIGTMGATLAERLSGTFFFFAQNFNTSYKWAPVFLGLVVPGVAGLLVSLAMIPYLRRALAKAEEEKKQKDYFDLALEAAPATPPEGAGFAVERFGLLALSYLLILFGYHYLLGPFYLYHLLGCVSVFGVFICFALRWCPRWALLTFGALALFAGVMPGLPWAMMGTKVVRPDLVTLHNLGMETKAFLKLKYGEEPRMWEKINDICRGSALLTHENRHLLFDPSIRLTHFDDWEIQQIWDKPREEKLRALKELGVKYYLRIPFEKDHPINARLGHEAWIADGTLKEVFRAGDETLYVFQYN